MNRFRSAVVVRAHAKINLDLRVLGTRPDGFHELRTVFQTIALHDTLITASRARARSRSSARRRACRSTDSNLMWRAAAALWPRCAAPGEVRDMLVTLEKRCPLQAGLGGGSADAAATLVALARAWRVPVPHRS